MTPSLSHSVDHLVRVESYVPRTSVSSQKRLATLAGDRRVSNGLEGINGPAATFI
jgi:hypothetical protein